MIKSLLGESRRHLKHKELQFRPVYVAMMLLSLHWAVVLYVDSTYLGQYLSPSMVSALFVAGSLATIVSLYFIPRALTVYGNYRFTLGLSILETVSLGGIGFVHSAYALVPLFILHFAIVPLLLFNIDIFAEAIAGENEERTGRMRGALLVIGNLAGALSPLAAGILIGGEDPRFYLVYLASAVFMLPFMFIIHTSFKFFDDPRYKEIDGKEIWHACWDDINIRLVVGAHFLLQLFFAWMVIYVPLYLATVIGFKWDNIGVIIAIAIFAYVLFEYPVGRIADLYTGEKELMALGFMIMAVTTCWLSFLETAAIVPWTIAMFMTRVGASFVEATTETYFFKHTTGENAGVIGLFRILRPGAMVVGALFGSAVLLFLPFREMFIPLGLLMLAGIGLSLFLVDTK